MLSFNIQFLFVFKPPIKTIKRLCSCVFNPKQSFVVINQAYMNDMGIMRHTQTSLYSKLFKFNQTRYQTKEKSIRTMMVLFILKAVDSKHE